ncbi:olfactory receptor 11A1-like [Ascaphus truei]|uniref:olfactory receptor 11A1-like n=1 Tax=Ascaphus truei TaxID=8439 RepID=UPI003F5A5225
MRVENQTRVTEFLLLGFKDLHSLRIPVFFLFLGIYMMTLTGNLLIIVLVSTSHKLHSPMYFFLSHLSTTDILITTNIVPKMLHGILGEGATISFIGCMTQFYIFGVSAAAECLLLIVMSYDRYLAICQPLRYTSIMEIRLQYHLVFWSWVLGFTITLFIATQLGMLQFCGPNVIDHVFCDFDPLLELSCLDPSFLKLEHVVVSVPITFFSFIFIIVTYVSIFLTILRIPSTSGRQKAFSTCSSHLTVVSLFYGTLITIYQVPSRGHTVNLNKVLSLLYLVVTPFCNPIIYSLRSQEIRAAFWKLVSKKTRETKQS